MAQASDGTISVQGEAVVATVPDQIGFRLTVSAVKDRSEDALQEVTARGGRLDQLLTELGIPRDERSTSGVSVREHREWVDGRSEHRGFQAQTSVDVRIEDASIAGRLIQGAVDGAGAYVDGPWWHLDGDNPARTEACAAAARDAPSQSRGLRGCPGRSARRGPVGHRVGRPGGAHPKVGRRQLARRRRRGDRARSHARGDGERHDHLPDRRGGRERGS